MASGTIVHAASDVRSVVGFDEHAGSRATAVRRTRAPGPRHIAFSVISALQRAA
jgi:hypothetical protein